MVCLAIAMPALAGEKSVSIDDLVLDGILGVSKNLAPNQISE